MRHLLRSFALLSFLLFSFPSAAVVTIDGNIFYFSDSYVTSSTKTYSRTLWDAALSMDLTKKGSVLLGWAYRSDSFNDDTGTTTTVAATGMGPKLTFYFDRENYWSAAFTYYLILKGSDSATSVTYNGTGMKGEFGYTPALNNWFYLGIKLNYYQASFAEQVTNQTSLAQVSYSRTAIYPSIAFVMRFE